MRLCTEEWDALKYICKKENINRNKLVGLLDSIDTANLGLTSLTRLFLLMYYQYLAVQPKNSFTKRDLYLYIIEKIKHAGITAIK